ncbi:hypothetical protein B566_EDAN015715 [Ephemera danica]|nr:hypothetical protein B566_EDAN015715 [Ephemera danica]
MYRCCVCLKLLPQIQNLLTHIRMFHPNQLTYSCKQGNCSRKFSTSSSFRRHINLKHSHDTSNGEQKGDKKLLPQTPSQPSSSKLHENEIFEENENSPENNFSDDRSNKSKYNYLTLGIAILITKFSSEHLIFKFLENNGFYIPPKKVKTGTMYSEKRVNGIIQMVPIDKYAHFIPLRKTLKSFFELPDVFKTAQEFYKTAMDTVSPIYSILQGSLWRDTVKNYVGKIVFPLLLYFDDFETGNPLGSRAGVHKLGAVYYSIPSFPQYILTKLDNIFLAMLFHSQDRDQEFGNVKNNKLVFSRLIKELNFLARKGIEITTECGKLTIYFALTLIVGDNLGVNSILGFVESFRSHYFCRICKSSKEETQKAITENKDKVRTPQSYSNDIENNTWAESGIKEPSVWNKVTNYHAAVNFSVDEMHDVDEGIARYEMAYIINYIVNVKKFITLATLNSCIKYFNYPPNDNIPPPITETDLKNECLIMSSSEMRNLVMYFGLMVGRYIPEDDKVWELYISLRKIFELVYARVLQKSCHLLIKDAVEVHHQLYIDILQKDLKPKHHLLTHAARVFELAGPLGNISSIRFEANHKFFKEYARIIRCRKNLTFSLAVFNQLFFCNKLQMKESIDN